MDKLLKTLQDEMFIVQQYETPFPDEMFPDPIIPMRTAWRWRIKSIEQDFLDSDWPPFSGRVFIDDDENWSPVSAEVEEFLLAEGADARAEIFRPHSVRIERGLDYIHRRIDLLSVEYWLINEVKVLQGILAAPTPDAVLLGAIELGELTARAAQHQLHLPTLRTGVKVRRGASNAAWARMEENKRKRQSVLIAMRTLLRKKSKSSVRWAARVVADRGIGASPEANRTLWYRHNSK
ncbi:hypothetical protein [uncultured Limimaricola sp.]|uniref:hypothetical protein n=1 Tax=uncultured Limimaricola sp. TaxID=2211667 RepID=UPI0030FC9A63